MYKLAVIASMLLGLSTAYAEDTPTLDTFDFTKPLLNVVTKRPDIDPSLGSKDDQTCAKCTITFGIILARCLVTDSTVRPELRPAMWMLANRILDAKAAKLSQAEIELMKHCAETTTLMTPGAVGQVFLFFDPQYTPPEIK